MNALSLNNLWTYLQGLSLSASNKKWLADHLYESAGKDEAATSLEDCTPAQIEVLMQARDLTSEQLKALEKQATLSPEDLKLLLYRTVDDVYREP